MIKIYKTIALGFALIVIMLIPLLIKQERMLMIPFLLSNKTHFFTLSFMLFLTLILFHFQPDNKRSEKDKKRDKKIEGMMFVVCWYAYICFVDIVGINMPHLLILMYAILSTSISFLFIGHIDEKYLKNKKIKL